VLLVGDVAEADRELVAAEPGQRVTRAQHALEPAGGLRQQAVAGAVAERVVDDLEVVEVQEKDGDLAVAQRPDGDRLEQQLQEARPVGDARQRVGTRLQLELLLRGLAIGDVEALEQELAVARSRPLPEAPPDRSVGAHEATLELALVRG
jgi:hypothetical protein